MDLGVIRNEIERMRIQVGRQRREILQLQRAGNSTASAEALLHRRTRDAVRDRRRRHPRAAAR
jgi:hypothetical protein